MGKPLSYEAARSTMAALCARSEQSSKEILEKLRRRGVDKETSEKVLNYLIDNKFVDDMRYARAFAHDKMAFQSWGRNKIRVGLIQKGISSDKISKALEELDSEEYRSACRRAAGFKVRSLDLGSREDTAKLYRYLASRGFEADIIRLTVDEIREEPFDI